mmetsp:Transcript_44801/g.122373  ORF Transcript_44801/g.122373 Transcript_44801/m.122373 type:complete len:254 (+) Transcript_44801:43-804(+)
MMQARSLVLCRVLLLLSTGSAMVTPTSFPLRTKPVPIRGPWPKAYPAKDHCSNCGLCDTTFVAHVVDACAFLGDGMSRAEEMEERVHGRARSYDADHLDEVTPVANPGQLGRPPPLSSYSSPSSPLLLPRLKTWRPGALWRFFKHGPCQGCARGRRCAVDWRYNDPRFAIPRRRSGGRGGGGGRDGRGSAEANAADLPHCGGGAGRPRGQTLALPKPFHSRPDCGRSVDQAAALLRRGLLGAGLASGGGEPGP